MPTAIAGGEAGRDTAPPPKSLLILIAFIVFIDMMGIGLVIPVMPDLIAELTGRNVAGAAIIGGWLLSSYAIMQFLFSPIIGGVSDRFGRRPVLLITLALLGVDYAIMAWAPDLIWLFLARIISGIMGASWAAVNSCIADITAPENRGRYFGMLGGAGAMGFVLGPALGGLLGEINIRLPFIMACVMALGGASIGFFMLKETLPEAKRRTFTLSRANPLGSLFQMAKTPLVLGFLGVIFLLQMGAQSQIAVWSYYTIEKFDWSLSDIGWSVALFGVLLAAVQGVLTGVLIKYMGDRKTALLSLLFGVPAYLTFAFAGASWVMILGIFIGAATGFAFPAMQQMMSSRINADAQGELQGAIASIVSLTSIFGPVVMTSVFKTFADGEGVYFPGAPFILAAILSGSGFMLYAVTVRRFYPIDKS